MATDGSNDKQSVDQIATFLGTRKLADFCRNEIIPKMNNEQFVDTLTKNANLITTIMVNHDIDSLSVLRIEADAFADFVKKQTNVEGVDSALIEFWYAVQGYETYLGRTMKWEHIANSVNHEMTKQIAECIQSVSSAMGDFDWSSGGKLVKEINTKTKRKLTDSEAKYLRSLVGRATNKIVLTPNGDSS